MRQLTLITLLFYYTLGTLCLPMGDFSILPSLPKMYHHCKTTEDCDMTPLDFVTDHLINIDGLFDGHDGGDDQKPHQPFHFHNVTLQLFIPIINSFTIISDNSILFQKKSIITTQETIFTSDYFSRKFRPPIS